MVVCGFTFAVGGCCVVGLTAPPLEPHAASSSSDAATRPPNFMDFIPRLIDSLPLPCRAHMYGPPSRPGGPAGLQTSGRRPERPCSGAPPPTAPRDRGV